MGLVMMSGQVTPLADTVTSLATVPVGRIVRNPVVTVNNTDDGSHTYSILIALDGATLADKQYIRSDVDLAAGVSAEVTIPHVLNAGDVIRVASDGAEVVNFFVQEVAVPR